MDALYIEISKCFLVFLISSQFSVSWTGSFYFIFYIFKNKSASHSIFFFSFFWTGVTDWKKKKSQFFQQLTKFNPFVSTMYNDQCDVLVVGLFIFYLFIICRLEIFTKVKRDTTKKHWLNVCKEKKKRLSENRKDWNLFYSYTYANIYRQREKKMHISIYIIVRRIAARTYHLDAYRNVQYKRIYI